MTSNLTSPGDRNNSSVMADSAIDDFLQPGEGKIPLVEGHTLFVNATKLHIMRRKAQKVPSKMLRSLLDYYFDTEVLRTHSATGEKSSKPPLPHTIIEPIREYVMMNFKVDPTQINIMINRKCLDAKRKTKH
ncbi:uncharacterized protein LOC117327814 [Pecten maximus]|uniref:uncharacterized protein LOC117327814 n=1 Tax=Pecten maximus TaxID=6579 RepID=UPI001458250F|nr:uncharacterized protein LOC117327814 [Pecten maximus]